jgi:hypothetical protein
MKHTDLRFVLLFLGIFVWISHTFSASFYSEKLHFIDKPPSTIMSGHVPYMAGATGICGIVPALVCAVHWCYQWWRSDGKQEDTPYPSPIIHCEYVPFFGERPERCKAEIALYEGIHDIATRSYSLDRTTRRFLRVHNLDDKHYTQCIGNVLQHALHAECVSLAHDTAHLKNIAAINTYRPILAQAIDAGRICVHENDIKHAVATIDWAHSLYRYLEAAISGIGEGIEETVSTFVHPYHTCKQLARSSHEMVRCTLRMFHELGLIETLMDADNDHDIEAYLDDRGRILETVAAAIKRSIASLTGPQATQKIAATVTQTVLTGKCLGVLLSFFTHAAHQAPHIIDRASKAVTGEQYMLAVADVGAVHIAQEAAQLSFFSAEKELTSGSLLGLAGLYKPLADEIDHLRTVFEKYLLDNDKTLVHVFEGEVNKFGELGGLHHDYLGYLEAHGKIRVLGQLPNGMYKAEVWFNGMWEEKSFFPKHWTRAEVLTRVTRMLDQPHRRQIGKKGKIIIRGFIEQTEVRVVLTPSGKIITCFPDITR